MLEVAYEGKIISKSVIFEYKEHFGANNTTSTVTKDISHNTELKEKYLRTLLLQKLEALDISTVQEREFLLEQPLDSKVKLKLI